MIDRRAVRACLFVSALSLLSVLTPRFLGNSACGQGKSADDATTNNPSTPILRIGVIGLDTSHAPAFAKQFNDEKASGLLAKQQVVAAFPGGSDDIESSYSRVAGYTADFKALGIEIVDSIDALLERVDAVMLLSLDGRKHLAQVLPVFKSNKPVYIDKPFAGTLSDAIAIEMLGKKYNARWFSCSSLRFTPEVIRYREDASKQKEVHGAVAWSPCYLDPTHPDLYWYGVHGVESLYTVMGTGCEKVTRINTQGADSVVGIWSDGRIGEFRGLREGKKDYGLLVFGEKSIDFGGRFEGYSFLGERIATFFDGAPAPVQSNETIEMFAFMSAADESKAKGGQPVSLADVIRAASEQAAKTVIAIDP